MQNNTEKVSIKDLSRILGVSRNTGSKEYQIIISCLGLRRNYLTYSDLKKYGL